MLSGTHIINQSNMNSEFKAVFSNTKWSDDFYRFLQVIFHLYPEDKFHHLIQVTSKEKNTDEEIYKSVQEELPKINYYWNHFPVKMKLKSILKIFPREFIL